MSIHRTIGKGLLIGAFFSFVLGITLIAPTVEAKKLPRVKNVQVVAEAKKAITIKWKKVKRAGFYQIRVMDSNSKKLRLVKVKKKFRKKKIKKLEPRTTYKFQVRAGKKKKRGKWSKKLTSSTVVPDGGDSDSPFGDDDDCPFCDNEQDTTPPVLENLLVEFDDYNSETGRAGAFVFDEQDDKVFFEFGAVVDSPGGDKILPTFEYRIAEDAAVVSPFDGVISQVNYQEDNDDYSVIVAPTKNSAWIADVDHVQNLAVEEGDTVTAGDLLGNPGTWDADRNIGRVELDLFYGEKHRCPFDYFDTDLRATFEAKVSKHMTDWETFKGDTSLYDQEAMEAYGAAGCLAEGYTEEELE